MVKSILNNPMNFLEWLTKREKPAKPDYTDIGHGTNGPFIVWAYEDGRFYVGKTQMANSREGHNELRPGAWHRGFTGRYEINSKTVTITIPRIGGNEEYFASVIRSEVIPELEKHFEIKRILVYKSGYS